MKIVFFKHFHREKVCIIGYNGKKNQDVLVLPDQYQIFLQIRIRNTVQNVAFLDFAPLTNKSRDTPAAKFYFQQNVNAKT